MDAVRTFPRRRTDRIRLHLDDRASAIGRESVPVEPSDPFAHGDHTLARSWLLRLARAALARGRREDHLPLGDRRVHDQQVSRREDLDRSDGQLRLAPPGVAQRARGARHLGAVRAARVSLRAPVRRRSSTSLRASHRCADGLVQLSRQPGGLLGIIGAGLLPAGGDHFSAVRRARARWPSYAMDHGAPGDRYLRDDVHRVHRRHDVHRRLRRDGRAPPRGAAPAQTVWSDAPPAVGLRLSNLRPPTERSQTGEESDWRETDRLKFRVPKWTGWRCDVLRRSPRHRVRPRHRARRPAGQSAVPFPMAVAFCQQPGFSDRDADGVYPPARPAHRGRGAVCPSRHLAVLRRRFQSGRSASPVSLRRDAGHAADSGALRHRAGAHRIADGTHGNDRAGRTFCRGLALDVPVAPLRALLSVAATGCRSGRARSPAMIVSRSPEAPAHDY